MKFEDHFPKTSDECRGWKPLIFHAVLDTNVLAVAKTRVEGAWAAYIGAMLPGDEEYDTQRVLDYGTKLDQKVACAIFPQFDDIPYAL